MHVNVFRRCYYLGLAEGVLDNKETPNTFRLFIERRTSSSSPSATSRPSLNAQRASLELIHPFFAFPQRSTLPSSSDSKQLVNVTSSQFHSVSFLKTDALPCDVHLLNVRTMRAAPENDADFVARSGHRTAVLLHRLGVECLQCRSYICRSSALINSSLLGVMLALLNIVSFSHINLDFLISFPTVPYPVVALICRNCFLSTPWTIYREYLSREFTNERRRMASSRLWKLILTWVICCDLHLETEYVVFSSFVVLGDYNFPSRSGSPSLPKTLLDLNGTELCILCIHRYISRTTNSSRFLAKL